MKTLLVLLALLVQTNAVAMGPKPAPTPEEPAKPAPEQPAPQPAPPPAPAPAPVIPEAPKYSQEEIKEFISNNDFYDFKENLLSLKESNCYFNSNDNAAPFFYFDATLSYYYKNLEGAKCLSNVDPVLRAPMLLGYKLKSMAKNGKNYVMEVSLKSHLMSHLNANRDETLRYRYEGRLTSCDGIPMNDSTREGQIEDLIENLQGINFKDFYYCQLELDLKVSSSEFVDVAYFKDLSNGSQIRIGRGSFTQSAEFAKKIIVNLYQNGQADFNYTVSTKYSDIRKRLANRSPFTPDPVARTRAIQSAKEFIKLLKSHGVEIARSAMLKNITERERQTIILQSLLQKKDLIINALNGVNSNFDALAIVDKLSVSKAVSDAYYQLKSIERSAGVSSDYTMMLELNPYMLGD